MEIKEQLTNVNYTAMTNKVNKYIVIHYVGAVSSAKNNADYFKSVNRNASANYFVDENDIYRVVRDSDRAWHCGSTVYKHPECRNTNSIGIEMCCYNNNGVVDVSEKVVSRTVELTKELMAKYNIPASNVIRHYDVTGKNCPAPFVSNVTRWNDFKNRLSKSTVQPAQPAQTVTSLKYSVGQKVKVSSYYASSTDPVSKAVIKNATGTITKVLTNGCRNPYLLDNGNIGWCNDGDIREVVTGTVVNSYTYYPACSSKYNSLVDALSSVKIDSSFANRSKIASKNGISNYSGTASQNNTLLSKLKSGKLVRI